MSFTATTQQTLQVTGSNNNTWGGVANLNFSLADQAIGGLLVKSVAGASNVTLAWPVGTNVGNEANCPVAVFTGALTGNITVLYPATSRRMQVVNATTGLFTLSVGITGSSGTTVTVPQTAQMSLWADGTNVNSAMGVASIIGGFSALGGGPQTVIGGMSVDMLTVGGSMSITGGLAVTTLHAFGPATIGGALAATTIVASGPVTVGALTASSITDTGPMTISGALSATTVSASGPMTVFGALTATTINASGPATVAGLTTTTLNATGAGTIGGGLTVTTIKASGASTITGALSTTTIVASGPATIGGALSVTGAAQFGASATVTSNLTVNNAAFFNGAVVVNNSVAMGNAGFQGTSPIGKPTVTGAKGGNAALGSLMTALSSYGLVADSTT